MSAFTKGPARNVFVCVSRAHLPRPATRDFLSSRTFRSSAFRRAAAPPRRTTPVQSAAKTPAKNTNPSTYAFVKQLAQKGTPTVLYEAPPMAG
ncbi:unnamed protein product [Parascedosporium putredinis]|uniref:Uncharacterized protein n=1 Tax=Parascedosporium putredinis TaxID=1442378 RepID=A0A9P1HAR4_9PEZI|nr:unnamed protein product [Parascedosporium putredinis]CAI8001538.1 unnamed protein product [Parascedosporium putredinis]